MEWLLIQMETNVRLFVCYQQAISIRPESDGNESEKNQLNENWH